jgi:hypothetical protein
VPHPRVEGSRRARLFAFLDDHSRLFLDGVATSPPGSAIQSVDVLIQPQEAQTA